MVGFAVIVLHRTFLKQIIYIFKVHVPLATIVKSNLSQIDCPWKGVALA
ncbi:hypothetical protein P20495_0875 [Pseudoalteromonas sp. BSi20495]|nr:hypothetical protein P20495_0875 [Pseudoalteromonas sp. BSi20495]